MTGQAPVRKFRSVSTSGRSIGRSVPGLSVPVLYSEDRIMYRPERIGLAERVVRRGRHFNLPEKANRSAL